VLALPRLPAASIDDVVADLEALRGQLPRRDGLRYFNRLYLEVTTQVRGLVGTGAAADPAFLSALDVAFANAYLTAIIAAESGTAAVSPAWRPVFEDRFAKRVAPIQFALAGVNAHINFDLPLQIVATCRARGVRLAEGSPEHHAFAGLTTAFERAEASAKRWLLTGLIRRIDRLLGHVDDRIAIWSVQQAREAAWTNALALSALHDAPELATAFQDTLGHTVGAFGRGLLVPSIPGLQRWTDVLRPA